MAAAKVLTAEQKQAIGVETMNLAINAYNDFTGSNLPEITADTWGSWVDGFINSRNENQFYPYLLDTIFEQFVSKANYNNKLAPYKKGFVANGAGVKQTFIDKIDALPYAGTSDVEKEELRTYLADIYEARYLLNMQRKYPVTLGRVQFRGYVESPEKVINLIDDVKSMLYTSNEMDEYGLMKTLLQNYLLQGKAYVVPVNMQNGLDDFAAAFREMSMVLDSVPTRDYNEFGVMNNTPVDRQVLFISAKMAARYSVNVLSAAFNMSQVDYVTRVEVLDNIDRPYSELGKLRQLNNKIPEIGATDQGVLGNVVAVLADREFFQVYDVVNEMWEKERASRMDINYFLHIWQVYAHSPFCNVCVFVDSTYATELPATINMQVVGKNITPAGIDFTVEIERTANSLVGGNLNLVQTDELAGNGILVTKTGFIRIPTGQSATLDGKIRDTEYKAGTALSATTNVGDTIAFNKQ